ncbi:MAG: prephenate dehydrogenase/arogenate dehydrogenase family protein [Acidimicrobiales bacterium]
MPAEGPGRAPAEGPGRAVVVGTGLMGGSMGLALRSRGWHVAGVDSDPGRAGRALALGAVDAQGFDDGADLVVIATPLGSAAGEARKALSRVGPGAVVTDMAGVKAPVVAEVTDRRFVGGHPMAGSEQEGLDGSDADLFNGATWVLTPTALTDPLAFARLRAVLCSIGAEVVAIPPERHDSLVAVVSHVPHLVAASLVRLASAGAEEHASLLRLAAGGFRDMTRVASGHPAIWPDVCAANAGAITEALDALTGLLGDVRALVDAGDRRALYDLLERAREDRRSLPRAAPVPEELAEVRIPVADRPGALAEVTTLAGEMGVNIFDLEIAHSAEGDRGVLILVVDAGSAEPIREALSARGMHPALRRLA